MRAIWKDRFDLTLQADKEYGRALHDGGGKGVAEPNVDRLPVATNRIRARDRFKIVNVLAKKLGVK